MIDQALEFLKAKLVCRFITAIVTECFLDNVIFYVGFLDFIVKPLFDLLKDMLDVILPLSSDSKKMADIMEDPREGDAAADVETQHRHSMWIETVLSNCASNRDHWKERCGTNSIQIFELHDSQ